jgi:hypothetical protein
MARQTTDVRVVAVGLAIPMPRAIAAEPTPARPLLLPPVLTHDVHRRWGSVFWRSRARVIRGRLPVIGRPNADILHHGPPPAYAHGREAVGGVGVAGRRYTPASCAGHARRQACERLSAGWRVPVEPTMLRLNSHFLGF